ncbi:MAG: efflux RND transporter periplasmic adaptor subunit [Stenotrophomonas acidaminiphila]|nr:MAG: efflux RND transporter periplasmic adaptor subunit [Stenotrophomonas acidaminiphila]
MRRPGPLCQVLKMPVAVAAVRPRWLVAVVLLLGGGAIGAYFVLGKGASAKAPTTKAAPLVELVNSKVVDLPHIVEAQGHVVPLNEVEVRAQMEGAVASLHFEEGQDVSAGQLLFVLDPGQTAALVRQSKAKYAQITAELTDARRNYTRSQELVASKYISSSALDAAASKVDMLEAQQQAARAEIESSQVMAGYARITAPISGRAGGVAVRRGALVGPSDSISLVRIVQIHPIAVEFSLPERELAGLTQAIRQGQAQVEAQTEQGQVAGRIIFTDNAIDQATGTIRLKAEFDNADERLWPGAFVSLRVQAGIQHDAVVLPPQAVLEGPEGHFVYQVDADSVVSTRPVVFTGLQDGQAVVTGLPAGQAVVAEGNQSVSPGAHVRTRAPITAARQP